MLKYAPTARQTAARQSCMRGLTRISVDKPYHHRFSSSEGDSIANGVPGFLRRHLLLAEHPRGGLPSGKKHSDRL